MAGRYPYPNSVPPPSHPQPPPPYAQQQQQPRTIAPPAPVPVQQQAAPQSWANQPHPAARYGGSVQPPPAMGNTAPAYGAPPPPQPGAYTQAPAPPRPQPPAAAPQYAQQPQMRAPNGVQPQSHSYPQAAAPPGGMRPMPVQGGTMGYTSHRPIPHSSSFSQRPVPNDVTQATAGMQGMTLQGQPPGVGAGGAAYGYGAYGQQSAAFLPQGVDVPAVTDPAFAPRPDLHGAAVAVRISQGDLPHAPPDEADSAAFDRQGQTKTSSAAPVACPPELFVPANPRSVRLTCAAFPITSSLAKTYGLPLAAIVQPLANAAEEPVPVVNFGSAGIVRCRRCRSYVNFSCKFTGGGRHWVCSMCQFVNDVPAEYFSPLDERGYRGDVAQRPELCRGTIELVAPAEYMVRPPMPPVYLFVLEVTPAAAASQALPAVIAGIKRSIDSMPNEGRTRVGIITFDSAVHFYTLRAGPDAEPSVSVVSDITDMFLPTPESILAQLSECRPAFEKTLDMIASSYARPPSTMESSASCMGAAVQGAKKALEFTGGRMVLFAASRPTAGPGALRDRGDQSLLGTDRERSVLRPDIAFYRQTAVEMSKVQIACDLFLCPPPPGHYMDVATIAQMAKFTGGDLFYAPSFEPPRDAPRLQLSVNRLLAREHGFEAVMRIRATRSVRCTGFSGRFFTRSTDLLAMPGVDADKAYSVQFTFDEASLNDGPFCIQVALLYTTSSGERRLRVNTVAVPATNSLGELLMRTDAAAMTNVFARMAADGAKDRVPEEVRKNHMERLVNALARYRELCTQAAPGVAKPTQLLMPNAMKLLPLYMHGLGKCPLLSKSSAAAHLYRFDDKAAHIHAVDVMSVAETTAMVYPAVIPVYSASAPGEQPPDTVKHPGAAPASLTSLRDDGAALVDDGRALIIYVGQAALPSFVQQLTGSNQQIDPRMIPIEILRRAATAKGRIRQTTHTTTWLLQERRAGTPVYAVVQGDNRLLPRVQALMTEDRSNAAVSYKEMLTELQRQVAQKVGAKR